MMPEPMFDPSADPSADPSDDLIAELDARPLLLPAAVAPADCARWLGLIDACGAQLPPDHADLRAGSGSMRLPVLGNTIFNNIRQTVTGGPVGAVLRQRLGRTALCLAGQCWAGRQHPASTRPAGQHPHHWHQDGALFCRFDATAEPEPLLDMITVWIPLMDCGDDAPSLQWIAPSPRQLLLPADLTEAGLLGRFGAAAHRHAHMSAGDALIFGGALLHRSHVTPTMSRRRVSVELRFLPAGLLPERLAHEAAATVQL